MIKVAHLTTAHPPDDIRVFQKECVTLAEAGYEVVLVAPAPRDLTVQGVRIAAVRPAAKRMHRITSVLPQVLRRAWKERAAVYHFHDPELILAGLLLRLGGRRVIYDVHENYPAEIQRSRKYIPSWARRPAAAMMGLLERVAGWSFNAVVTVSAPIAARFPAAKTHIVRNYPRLEQVTDPELCMPYAQRPSMVLFTGGFLRARCARAIVQAAGELVAENAQVVVVGPMESEDLRDELARMPGWPRVDYRGRVNQRAVAELLGQARVGLVLNVARPDFVEISTNKLYEFMAAGVPVIVSPIPSWRQAVQTEGCGVVADEAELSRAIDGLLADVQRAASMGERGAIAARERYDWRSQAAILLQCYEQVLGRREARPSTS